MLKSSAAISDGKTPPKVGAKLSLKDQTQYSGYSFGAAKNVQGEVVFNTGMSGYIETLTDPSYRGQILVLTYPLQGNYGVPEGPFESGKIQVQGLIVSRYSSNYSHYRAVKSLGEWLKSQGVPAIEGVDTRSLTRRLREHGTIAGSLQITGVSTAAEGVDMRRAAWDSASPEVTRHEGGPLKILVLDAGIKESIIRSLLKRGVSVIRAPFYHAWEEFLAESDGVLIGNGPGDPQNLKDFALRLKPVIESGKPVFGICLGHQIVSLAAGARTFKMKYGHRSQNQPVADISTGRCYITSQNHGYAVDVSSLSGGWESWFINLNDKTNEGIRHKTLPVFSVQFHPEAAPGPHDTAYLFDLFLHKVEVKKRG